ncbi:ABC transporter permease [Arcanobacterium haemolyticum]|nr:ABC transporter permease [Arcanobacterium haemolyticum]
MFSQLIGALVEAWGEVKVQRVRVILSLVGVTAAVAAMSTVIALGDLSVQASREQQEAMAGREVTLRMTAMKVEGEGGAQPPYGGMGNVEDPFASSNESDNDTQSAGWSNEATGDINDPVGAAMAKAADRFEINYWSRLNEVWDIEVKELTEAANNSTFHGMPITTPMSEGYMGAQLMAVDPAYATIFRLNPTQGRWLASGDVNQRITPVVINSTMWAYIGKPNLTMPTTLELAKPQGQTLRIVGMIEAKSEWDSPTIYMPYDSWELMNGSAESSSASSPFGGGSRSGVFWIGPDDQAEARKILPSAVKAILGDGWDVSISGGENWDTGADFLKAQRIIIMSIGSVVVLLGALGLLNVAIVTVRQRIREIGIRRAVGASAGRVFFAVFMESVVATFVAGVIGVGLAAFIVRMLPLEKMSIFLQDVPAFPMTAALAGIGIATGVGALCGIIPAVAAVKVKPIDAIRY